MSLGKTIPILRIFDEAKAREFYLEFLGFAVDWEHRFTPDLPLYMQVFAGGVRPSSLRALWRRYARSNGQDRNDRPSGVSHRTCSEEIQICPTRRLKAAVGQ